ncbi:Hypothetical_protein [Hexamita inflata]|uniref:Hypothetical_protein n=1 Tax=Hexamita inflata TaxID=28002 RepID=A0ABP1GIG3_9EUKA
MNVLDLFMEGVDQQRIRHTLLSILGESSESSSAIKPLYIKTKQLYLQDQMFTIQTSLFKHLYNIQLHLFTFYHSKTDDFLTQLTNALSALTSAQQESLYFKNQLLLKDQQQQVLLKRISQLESENKVLLAQSHKLSDSVISSPVYVSLQKENEQLHLELKEYDVLFDKMNAELQIRAEKINQMQILNQKLVKNTIIAEALAQNKAIIVQNDSFRNQNPLKETQSDSRGSRPSSRQEYTGPMDSSRNLDKSQNLNNSQNLNKSQNLNNSQKQQESFKPEQRSSDMMRSGEITVNSMQRKDTFERELNFAMEFVNNTSVKDDQMNELNRKIEEQNNKMNGSKNNTGPNYGSASSQMVMLTQQIEQNEKMMDNSQTIEVFSQTQQIKEVEPTTIDYNPVSTPTLNEGMPYKISRPPSVIQGEQMKKTM